MTRPHSWLRIAAAASLTVIVPVHVVAQEGDFNGDHIVDCTDGQLLIDCLFHGQPTCRPEMDFDSDGFVTALDLGYWFDLCAVDPTCHAKLASDLTCVTTAFYVDASIYLEGAYNGVQMATTLAQNGFVPKQHPFSGPPWSYAGPDSVVAVGDSVVDWVNLRLLLGDPLSQPMTLKAQRAALLLDAGAIVDTSGFGPVLFNVSPDSAYFYLVVASRNHLSVMSSDTLTVTAGVARWDFRSNASRSFTGGDAAVASLPGGKYGLFACDANADGQITAPDFNLWNASTTAGETGYRQADCNMDGIVTAPDFNLWNANTTAGANSQVPD